MARASRRRRIAVVVMFAVSVWAIAATSAPYKVIEVPGATSQVRLDADHPAALTRIRVELPPAAAPGYASPEMDLVIDAVRHAVSPVAPTATTSTPDPATVAPNVRLVVMAAVPDAVADDPGSAGDSAPAPWQAEVAPGRIASLPVTCRVGPCERGFWLIAQLEDPSSGPVDVDWHVEGQLGYGGNWPVDATAMIAIGPTTPIAGPAPQLAVATRSETLTLGPAAPTAARVVEVKLAGRGDSPGAAAALRVDLTRDPSTPGGDLPLVQVIPISDEVVASVATPLPVDGDPFADCPPGDACTRTFLVTFAWTGTRAESTTFDWVATLRRTDLLEVWTSGATVTAEVVRRFDLASTDPAPIHLEGETGSEPGESSSELSFRFRSGTTSDDPLARLLPVPATMTYRADALGNWATGEDVRAGVTIRSIVGSAGSSTIRADLEEGRVTVAGTPPTVSTDACRIGTACPDLRIETWARLSNGDPVPDARFRWTLDVEVFQYEDVPVDLEVDEPVRPTP